jgi:Na+-driven multidrug efflux pump
MSSIFAFVSFVFVESFPETIVKLFNSNDKGLMDFGKEGLRMCLLALPFVGFQVVSGNFFQSMGKAKIALFLTLNRQVIILIPLLFLLPGFFGLHGIWLAMPISDFCSAVIVVFFLVNQWRNLTIQENTNSI